MPSFQIRKKMETRKLHNSELKKLVSVLHGATTKEYIKSLPRHLRTSTLSSASTLCAAHKGLNATLIDEMWSWVQYEFERGIGKLVLPVIMSGKLTSAQESKIRQLEPVLQMWHKGFITKTSAPPGRYPIHPTSDWSYEKGQCSACMLTRIGADTDVLTALYAGMIARFPTCKLSSRRLILAELGVSKLDNPKSKRVRFVRYWLKASTKGDQAVLEAAELGIVVKKMYREWEDERRAETPSVYGRVSMEGTRTRNSLDPFHDGHRSSTDERPCMDVHRQSSHYSSRPHTSNHDSKLGPQPHSPEMHPHTPLKDLGYEQNGYRVRDSSSSTRPLLRREDSDDTLRPDDSITTFAERGPRNPSHHPISDPNDPTTINLPALPTLKGPFRDLIGKTHHHQPPKSVYAASAAPNPLAPKKTFRRPSITSLASTCTIESYDGGAPAVPPRSLLRAQHQQMYNLPVPQTQSVYRCFGGEKVDPFEDADEDEEGHVETQEQEQELPRGRRASKAATSRSELY
jgi:hypothetical protein